MPSYLAKPQKLMITRNFRGIGGHTQADNSLILRTTKFLSHECPHLKERYFLAIEVEEATRSLFSFIIIIYDGRVQLTRDIFGGVNKAHPEGSISV
jgi:hypothetical protein